MKVVLRVITWLARIITVTWVAVMLVGAGCATPTAPSIPKIQITPTSNSNQSQSQVTPAPNPVQVSQGAPSPASPVPAPYKPTISAPINLMVSAAASLTDVLKEINQMYSQNGQYVITTNLGSSGTLQTQIENGAPVDIFMSAASTQMDNLQNKGLILNDTRQSLLNNRVVLVVPLDSTLNLTSFADLTADKVKKIAIGDPKSVPAGTYALQAFDQLGITAKLQPKEVLGADVRQVLTYVETNNVDAGIVYATDAMTSTKVKVVASAPAEINAKITYPVAVIKASKNQDAAKIYINFLFSSQAKTIFEKYGFTVIGK